MKDYFVLVLSNVGVTLIGRISKVEFIEWSNHKCALHIREVQGMRVSQRATNAEDSISSLALGPAYIGDTPQVNMYLEAGINNVEIIGTIEVDDQGNEFCIEHARLFNAYRDGLKQWRALRSNISIPNASQIAAINTSKGNIHPFPPQRG